MNTKQPRALVLAERLDAETEKTVSIDLMHFEAAAELRRLHAENEALERERDEYQQAADKMAMEHKIERDRWIPMFDALQEESQALRQQLAEAQRDTVKQIADAAFRHGLSLVKTDTGFELLRLGTAIAAMKGAA